MLICPLQSGAVLTDGVWQVKWPYITQGFGERPEYYAKYGMNGHNGIDFRAPMGTKLFSPIEGKVQVIRSTVGYGLHIIITKSNLKVVLGHLSEVFVRDGDLVHLGDKIGLTGNSGDSSAPHLHVTVKKLDDNGNVIDADNGFGGAFDFQDLTIRWKGTLKNDEL